MNLAYLGDALDHWKGSIFEALQNANVIKNFAIDIMASDFYEWEQEDFKLYANLLRVNREQIVHHKINLSNRHDYFQEISHTGDLFVDPDTGVATGKVKELQKYVKPAEIGYLLKNQNKRILIIYQHVRAQKVAARVDQVLRSINKYIEKFAWTSYESGNVAMLFLSLNRNRITDVVKYFKAFLGRHTKNRIRNSFFDVI